MAQETLVDGVNLRFYTHVNVKHDGMLLSEWLLEQAKKHKLGGGSVFRAIAGFGRHGVLHQEAFFELADDLPVKVEFVLSESEADTFLQLVRDAGIELVYVRMPVRIGILGKENRA
jgi:PII-like signaling protein